MAGASELQFAIRAINEASRQLKEIQGDLDSTGKAASDADPKMAGAGKSTRDVGDAAEHSHGPLSKLGGALGDVAKIAGGFVLAHGIMEAPGFFKDAAQAAAEDEAATARLNTTMRGLTDESGKLGPTFAQLSEHANDLIDSGQRLAFADDEIRDSFGKLLDSTGSVSEATERLAAAQDLARGRNIPLADATKLLGKLSDENVQIFKRMGITMKDNATEADVLATVQAKFGGQAKAYAQSTAGQFEQAKIAMSEIKEAIGYAVLPMFTALASKAAELLPTIQAFAGELADKVGPFAAKAAGAIADLAGAAASATWDAMRDAWAVIQPLLEKVAAYTWQALLDLANVSWDRMQAAWESISDRMGAMPWGKIKDEAADTSNWAAAWDSFLEALQPAIDALKPLVEQVLASLKNQFEQVHEALMPLIDALREWEPVLKPLAIAIGVTLVAALAAFLVAVRLTIDLMTLTFVAAIKAVTLVIRSITEAVDFVSDAFREWPGIVGAYLSDVVRRVTDFGTSVASVFTGLWSTISGWFSSNWETVTRLFLEPLIAVYGPAVIALGLVAAAFEALWSKVSGWIAGTWNTVTHLLAKPVEDVVALHVAAFGLITGAFDALWGTVSGWLSTTWSTVTGLLTGPIDAAVTALVDVHLKFLKIGADIIAGVVSGIGDAAGTVTKALFDAWDVAIGGLGNPADWLVGTGWKIIQGLVNGLWDAANTILRTALNGITDLIPDWKGPADKDAQLLYPTGQSIIQGLVAGMRDAIPAVEQALTGLTNDIPNWMPMPFGGGGGGGGGGGWSQGGWSEGTWAGGMTPNGGHFGIADPTGHDYRWDGPTLYDWSSGVPVAVSDPLTTYVSNQFEAGAAGMYAGHYDRSGRWIPNNVSLVPRGGTVRAMADGGIVRHPTVALIGESGPEAVVPLGRGRLGGVTININAPVYGIDDLYYKLDRAARQMGLSGLGAPA